ncbi:MAG: hypothetical protein WA615_23040, partial [Bradyrhizobium sp.]
ALRLAGEEASIVELSWYGSGEVAAPLGEARRLGRGRQSACGPLPSRSKLQPHNALGNPRCASMSR